MWYTHTVDELKRILAHVNKKLFCLQIRKGLIYLSISLIWIYIVVPHNTMFGVHRNEICCK